MSNSMTPKEYEMTFAEWCKYVKKRSDIVLEEDGHFSYGYKMSKIRDECYKVYYDEWMYLREDFWLRKKHYLITNALESLRKNGIECRLNNWQNGCITAMTKNGRKMTYYATTETIAGYGETTMSGLETFIALCKQ